MRKVLYATLAASLLCTAGAFAQPDSLVGKIAGKKFYAADGSSLTLVAYKGGMAREIHTSDGTTAIEVFSWNGDSAGTVSDGEAGTPGKFELSDATLNTEFNDGHSEIMAMTGAGVQTMTHGASGELTCTAWYPEGHRFSASERQAALIAVSDNVGLNESPVAKQGCGSVATREAQIHVRHEPTRTAMSPDDGTLVARLPE